MHYAFRGCSWFRISDVLQVACLSRLEGASVKPEAPRTSTFCMEAGTIGDTNVGAYTHRTNSMIHVFHTWAAVSGLQLWLPFWSRRFLQQSYRFLPPNADRNPSHMFIPQPKA
jgi:hypothetical protein